MTTYDSEGPTYFQEEPWWFTPDRKELDDRAVTYVANQNLRCDCCGRVAAWRSAGCWRKEPHGQYDPVVCGRCGEKHRLSRNREFKKVSGHEVAKPIILQQMIHEAAEEYNKKWVQHRYGQSYNIALHIVQKRADGHDIPLHDNLLENVPKNLREDLLRCASEELENS